MSSRTIIDYHAPFDRGLRQASFCLHRDDATFLENSLQRSSWKKSQEKIASWEIRRVEVFSRTCRLLDWLFVRFSPRAGGICQPKLCIKPGLSTMELQCINAGFRCFISGCSYLFEVQNEVHNNSSLEIYYQVCTKWDIVGFLVPSVNSSNHL